MLRIIIKLQKTKKFFIFSLTVLCFYSCIEMSPVVPKKVASLKISVNLRKKIERLYSSDLRRRLDAAYRLGEMGKGAFEAVPFLIPILLESDEPMIKERVVWALGRIGDTRAAKPLILALKDDNERIRERTAEALGAIKDPRAIKALITASKDYYKEVRRKAIEGLGKIGKPAVTFLLHMANNKNKCEEAIWILGKMGQSITEYIVKELKNKDPKIREKAAWALGEIKDKLGVIPLIAALKDKVIRKKVVWALGRIGDHRAVTPFLKIYNEFSKLKIPEEIEKMQDIKYSIVESLGEINDIRALSTLITALTDKDWMVRKRAVWALGEINDLNSIKPLINSLRDTDEWVRKEAIQALAKMKDFRAVEGLIKILNDKDSVIREKAAHALGIIKSSEAVEGLIEILKDKDRMARKEAIWALGEIKDSRAVIPLVSVLEDENLVVRINAALALEKITRKRFNQDIKKWRKWLGIPPRNTL